MYYTQRYDLGPEPHPYGMSGMGQVIPGIKAETTQLVIYGSVILVFGSALIYFLTRKRPGPAAPAKGGRK